MNKENQQLQKIFNDANHERQCAMYEGLLKTYDHLQSIVKSICDERNEAYRKCNELEMELMTKIDLELNDHPSEKIESTMCQCGDPTCCQYAYCGI